MNDSNEYCGFDKEDLLLVLVVFFALVGVCAMFYFGIKIVAEVARMSFYCLLSQYPFIYAMAGCGIGIIIGIVLCFFVPWWG